MSITYLGRHFDIHTGGVDHIPVHHTNEIAQSDAYLDDGERWVDWWLHGEFINLKNAKMSKSTGDGGLLVSGLAQQGYHPLVYRYLLLQAHYRSQVEFSWEAMDSARTGLRRLLDRYATVRVPSAQTLGETARAHLDAFDAAISDDLNTAKALAVVGAAARDDAVSDAELASLATDFDAVLAIGLADLTAADLDVKTGDVSDEVIDALVAERDAARAAKDFARSDELRDALAAMGVTIEDRATGQSTWRWS
jgi:cysteinyl-tRNA synthetase